MISVSFRRSHAGTIARAAFEIFERLESRTLLSVSVSTPIQPQALSINATASLDLFRNFTDPNADPVATVTTDQGAFQIQLFAQQTPRTVDNFADYVNSGAYNGTVVHRSLPGFVVQMGGYKPDFTHIANNPRLINEPGISNTLGTVAMAKLGGTASSATNEFFVNTGGNAANLDAQNAGFTVFGQILNGGLPVVNQINNLPTTTVQGFSDVSVKTNPPAIPADLVNVQSIALTPQFTYTIANSNPGVLTAQLNGEELQLTSGAQTGAATITVTATDSASHSVTQTFAVTVGTASVVIGAGQTAQTVNFVAANKSASSVSLKGGGSATLTFSGSNVSSTTRGSVTTVTGSGLKIANIATTATGADSVLTIAGSPEVDHVAADASLKQINAKGVTLNGSIEAAGTVTTLSLNKALNGRISLGGSSSSPALTTITLGSATDEDLVSDSPIKSITVGSWGNNNSVLPLINAPSIGLITSKGAFTPSLDIGYQNGSGSLLGNLGAVKIGGAIGAGHWRVLGSAPRFRWARSPPVGTGRSAGV